MLRLLRHRLELDGRPVQIEGRADVERVAKALPEEAGVYFTAATGRDTIFTYHLYTDDEDVTNEQLEALARAALDEGAELGWEC